MVMDKNHPMYKYRHEKMNKKDVGTITEYPFFYDGMTFEEYEEEREYYWKTPMEDILNLNYKPLWKQRQEQKEK